MATAPQARVRKVEAGGGLTVDKTRLVVLNFGLRAPDPQEPYFTAAEADVLGRPGFRKVGSRRPSSRGLAP